MFNDLIILDIANNHFGDVKHCKKIIDSFTKISKINKINSCFKFQFRNLKTFIDKSEAKKLSNSYTKRFLSTEMSFDSFLNLKNYITKKKQKTACTPFDEDSVKYIEKFKFDYLKIASASANDWPLLERVVKNKIPKIISTGGLNFSQIDKVVSFMMHKNQKFCLLHCVALYPSNNRDLNLKIIQDLHLRYPDISIGWSTHESPENYEPVKIAYSMGARVFEKHIGVETKKYKLNQYSLSPISFQKWIDNLTLTKKIIGSSNYIENRKKEKLTLNKLERGVYALREIKKNSILNKNNVYFAFPKIKNQISSSQFTPNIKITKNLKKGQPINIKILSMPKLSNDIILKHHLHKVRAILNYSKINLGNELDLEISHHFGIEKINKFGCVLINCINRKYCKKIIILTKNQRHPLHYHKIKEETFHILYGKLFSKLNGNLKILLPGDKILVKPNVVHEFWSGKQGCIFEEVSTTSFKSDSYYIDKKIQETDRMLRKTNLKYKIVYN